MTITEQLQAAREKISKPEDWCQGSYAKDANGNNCPTHSKEAVAWCARGALGFPCGIGTYSILSDASLHLNQRTPSAVNDNGTHADVMKMYDFAIQMSKKNESGENK